MKDTVISAKRKKIELLTLLACFIIANAANVYAIIAYDGHAVEILTTLGYVAIATIVLYAIWTFIRLVAHAIRRCFHS
jgi:hypothetical protein